MDLELALTTILAVGRAAARRGAVHRGCRTRSCSWSAGSGWRSLPAIPDVELDPELVLIVILPPLLYAAAFFTPLRELRRNVRAISLLAVGLVLATMVGVARRRPRGARLRLGAGVRARRDRLPHRSGRRDRDRAPARRPGADRDDRRGREPDQRRHRPGRLQVRGRRGRHRQLQPRSRPAASSSSACSAGVGVGIVVGAIIAFGPPAASTTRRSRSRSPCSAATSPTCPPRRSASRACSPRSPSASTWAG